MLLVNLGWVAEWVGELVCLCLFLFLCVCFRQRVVDLVLVRVLVLVLVILTRASIGTVWLLMASDGS